jgi:hypothetical protein
LIEKILCKGKAIEFFRKVKNMLNPSFDFKTRDYAKLGRAGVVEIGKSLLEVAKNLVGVLIILSIGLLKVLKLIK